MQADRARTAEEDEWPDALGGGPDAAEVALDEARIHIEVRFLVVGIAGVAVVAELAAHCEGQRTAAEGDPRFARKDHIEDELRFLLACAVGHLQPRNQFLAVFRAWSVEWVGDVERAIALSGIGERVEPLAAIAARRDAVAIRPAEPVERSLQPRPDDAGCVEIAVRLPVCAVHVQPQRVAECEFEATAEPIGVVDGATGTRAAICIARIAEIAERAIENVGDRHDRVGRRTLRQSDLIEEGGYARIGWRSGESADEARTVGALRRRKGGRVVE